MKMKELERRTGVSREAIRYYIREGLLPEPERPKKNVARYKEAHVAGIQTIKQLQAERDLPLEVIKPILAAQSRLDSVKPAALSEIITQLSDHLGMDSGSERVPLEMAEEQTGLALETLTALADVGIIDCAADEGGVAGITRSDLMLASLWADVDATSSKALGELGIDAAQRYFDLANWLADQETSSVYKQLVKSKNEPDIAGKLQTRVSAINAFMVALHSAALIKRLRGLQPVPRKKQALKKR
ncbi:MAG: MerR family transcriptional regulator [Pseudomonadota bacterium]